MLLARRKLEPHEPCLSLGYLDQEDLDQFDPIGRTKTKRVKRSRNNHQNDEVRSRKWGHSDGGKDEAQGETKKGKTLRVQT